ncbi:glycosyltransferase family 4 protein [Flavobacterium sp. MAH-1]|uniref:Glycosyltransferase family 4 protein n=1 Tax=Flavobacterium agri TaxID=2743471 RepID=A0A7Y9C5Y5_9FLAO|nr:glycosyltransferase family 4 protein [Flavobacterium agri]NUY80900.1 glycosyltransferase family 4 protein [Flavobacterium agri]NYA70924.1 glycosyltransferase family 4 protein [Flavobacterium agri]
MHIGFLTPEFPHPRTGNSGGIGTSIANLSAGLIALGHKVSILVYGQKEDVRLEQDGMSIHLIKNRKIKGLSRFLTQKKIRKLINGLVLNEQLDLIEAPDWTGITSGIKPKCPVVVRLHGSDTYFCDLENRQVKPINRSREKRALENADAIVSVSRFTADRTLQIFGLNADITVIPNGLDAEKFTPSQTEMPERTVLYFGTLIRKKGLLELPHIFNKVVDVVPDAKLVLIGRDSYDIQTQSTSTWQLMKPIFTPKALQNVEWVGPVEYAKIRNEIHKAQVCVFPTFAEALPVSWIEAMAMGKAIVASDIGWAPEIVSNREDGFLVHPTDHDGFASVIRTLLEDAELRKNIGQAAASKARAVFSNRIVAKQNEVFYLKTIQEYRR